MSEAGAETGVIEIRLRELAQLFNSLDPSPFLERDLDEDAEAHILGWARELPAAVPIELVVHLSPEEARKAEERGLDTAFANYFAAREHIVSGDLKELFSIGRRHLAVGIGVLTVCLIGSHSIEVVIGGGPLARVLEESLIIVGWVANWKPIEIFLYDWWPVVRRRNLYRRLAHAKVTVRVLRAA